MKSVFSMRPVMGCLLGADYTALNSNYSSFCIHSCLLWALPTGMNYGNNENRKIERNRGCRFAEGRTGTIVIKEVAPRAARSTRSPDEFISSRAIICIIRIRHIQTTYPFPDIASHIIQTIRALSALITANGSCVTYTT